MDGQPAMATAASSLRPRADGLLDASGLPAFAIMAPRLQGELSPDGTLSLSLWGTSEVARLSLGGLEGPLTVGPGRILGADGRGLFVGQSAPVLALRGVRPTLVHQTDEASLAIEPRDADWLLALGAHKEEVGRGLALDVPAVAAEAEAHLKRCDLLPKGDPMLRSLVMHGAHAALASIRQDEKRAFTGLAAGLAYATPPRTYYRDGYWTLQLLLRTAPEAARAQIDLLAQGVRPDGEAPSGVIVAGPLALSAWESQRLLDPFLLATHVHVGEWWSDHFDSPLFFVLAVGDYVTATGDVGMVERHWPLLKAVFDRYQRLSGAQGLPVKPRNDRDWADNVYRDGLVAYDLGLWVGALDTLARLGETLDAPLALAARQTAAAARKAIDAALWRGGWYADYVRQDGSVEGHLTLDSLTLLRYRAAPEDRALIVLEAVRGVLESRRNAQQPYGDFGMLCVFPPFDRPSDLRGKSAFPYRYHNGADWPWLDALYAGERLARGLGGWLYPLTRWWEYCLASGWAGAVEYFSPSFERGSLLQAWSSLPAAIALAYAEQVLAGDPEAESIGNAPSAA
jgi:glycogen debranching enzyme